MDSEWRTDVHPGYRTKVIRVGNTTVEINRPLLSDAERRIREDRVRDAIIQFERSARA